MTKPSIRLSFFKLNTPDMDRALKFYRDTFGFEITMTFDEPSFLEHILALPGQEDGPNLLLVEMKDGGDVTVGPGHGPVGFNTDDIEALHERALANGAKPIMPVFEEQGIKIAFFTDPDGHQIELVQLPGG